MTWVTGVVAYTIIWWVVLFAVLPFGVRTAEESDQPLEPGHAPSAPVRPLLLVKFAVTTLIATVLFVLFWLVQSSGVLEPYFRS